MWLYHKVMSPKDAEGIANSVDRDETALLWVCTVCPYLSVQRLRIITVSQKRPAKAQMSLRINTVLPEPTLLAHMQYGNRQKVQPEIRHLAPLDSCACAFGEWVYGGRKVP